MPGFDSHTRSRRHMPGLGFIGGLGFGDASSGGHTKLSRALGVHSSIWNSSPSGRVLVLCTFMSVCHSNSRVLRPQPWAYNLLNCVWPPEEASPNPKPPISPKPGICLRERVCEFLFLLEGGGGCHLPARIENRNLSPYVAGIENRN